MQQTKDSTPNTKRYTKEDIRAIERTLDKTYKLGEIGMNGYGRMLKVIRTLLSTQDSTQAEQPTKDQTIFATRTVKCRASDGSIYEAIIDDSSSSLVSKYSWRVNCSGYAYSTFWDKLDRKNKTVVMHRLIMNPTQGVIIDHINRCRLDNRRVNLREATKSQNACNADYKMDKSCNYRGVYKKFYLIKKPYMAKIKHMGKSIYLGYYKTAEEAAMRYNEEATKLFGDFANINRFQDDQGSKEE